MLMSGSDGLISPNLENSSDNKCVGFENMPFSPQSAIGKASSSVSLEIVKHLSLILIVQILWPKKM